jgi:hypothetical protein
MSIYSKSHTKSARFKNAKYIFRFFKNHYFCHSVSKPWAGQQSVTQITTLIVHNFVTPKAAAKLDILLSKPGSGQWFVEHLSYL